MATPKRPFGYQFDPKAGATIDEVMICLKVCINLLSGNSMVALGPNKEIEDLPAQVKQHFRKVEM